MQGRGYESRDRRWSAFQPMTREEDEMLEDQRMHQEAACRQLDEQRATEDYIDANFLASIRVSGGWRA